MDAWEEMRKHEAGIIDENSDLERREICKRVYRMLYESELTNDQLRETANRASAEIVGGEWRPQSPESTDN